VQGDDCFVELHAEDEAPVSPPSFDELFLDLHDRLYRALSFVTGSSHDAEELMQDAFLKLWERWDSIETITDPTAYLPSEVILGARSSTASEDEDAHRPEGSASCLQSPLATQVFDFGPTPPSLSDRRSSHETIERQRVGKHGYRLASHHAAYGRRFYL
jgi:Sigma-70 region 2